MHSNYHRCNTFIAFRIIGSWGSWIVISPLYYPIRSLYLFYGILKIFYFMTTHLFLSWSFVVRKRRSVYNRTEASPGFPIRPLVKRSLYMWIWNFKIKSVKNFCVTSTEVHHCIPFRKTSLSKLSKFIFAYM